MRPRSAFRVQAVLMLAIGLGGCAVPSAGPRWGGPGYYPRSYGGFYDSPGYYGGYGGAGRYRPGYGYGYADRYPGYQRDWARRAEPRPAPRVERWSQERFGAHIQDRLRRNCGAPGSGC